MVAIVDDRRNVRSTSSPNIASALSSAASTAVRSDARLSCSPKLLTMSHKVPCAARYCKEILIRSSRRKKLLAASLSLVLVVMGAVAAVVVVRGAHERAERADICAPALRLVTAADDSAWLGADRLDRYGAVEDFAAQPSPYATLWSAHMVGRGISDRPSAMSESAMLRTVERQVRDGDAAVGGSAAALSVAAPFLTASTAGRSFVQREAAVLLNGDGYADSEGGEVTAIATARVSQALVAARGTVPGPVTSRLQTALAEGSGPEASVDQIDTAAIASSALSASGESTPTQAELQTWLARLTASPIDSTTLPAVAHVLDLANGSSMTVTAPDARFEGFTEYAGGWWGIEGATTPDPQVTALLATVSGRTEKLDVRAGAVPTGWLPIPVPSVDASARWESILQQCDSNRDLAGEHTLSQIRDLVSKRDVNLAALVDLSYFLADDERFGAATAELRSRALAAATKQAAALDGADVVDRTRLAAVVARVGGEALSASFGPKSAPAKDALTIAARSLLGDDAAAKRDMQRLAVSGGGYRYSIAAKKADDASTAMGAMIVEDANGKMRTARDLSGAQFADVQRPTRNTSVTLLDLQSAVVLSGGLEIQGFVW